MDEKLKEQMALLLNNFWILKEDNSEVYYDIKRNQENIRDFVIKNLGSRLIIHDRFIKLEKIPSIASSNIGIPEFKLPSDYVFLTLILLFLEDKTRGTYFTLTNLIEYVKNTSVALELNNVPDWTLGQNRKSLARAIDFLVKIGAIKLKDESKVSFVNDSKAEALYQSSGLSNYVMRMFNNEIYDYKQEEDFVRDEWTYQDTEKGDVRKYKVYRNLLYTPAILARDLSESEMDYLKKLRGHMREELMNNLGYELEVTKNMTLVYDYDSRENKESFPNAKKISDIVLMVNARLLENILNETIVLDINEIGKVTKEFLFKMVVDIKRNQSIYLSKYFKDLTDENFFIEITEYMEGYSFIKRIDDFYEIYPMIRIFNGKLVSDKNTQLEIWSDVNV